MGPATAVRVHCSTDPRRRVEVRTAGEAVAVLGRALACLVLTSQQCDIMQRSPRLVMLTGPPGTGIEPSSSFHEFFLSFFLSFFLFFGSIPLRLFFFSTSYYLVALPLPVNETLKWLTRLPIIMQHHCGSAVALGFGPPPHIHHTCVALNEVTL